jgi:nucleoside-diphosphate-sugar epimerase
MTTLVTGGCGFIGSRLVKYLVDRGETVHVLDMPGAKSLQHPHVRFYEGDVLDLASVVEAMQGCTRVYHLAGYAKNWAEHSETFFETNVTGTRIVLEAARRLGVQKVVVTSSNLTFGPSNGILVTESSKRANDLLTPYARSKFLVENVARFYARQGLSVVIVNPTRVFGPGPLSEANSVTKMIAWYCSGSWRFILGNGKAVGNYVYVDDLVRGFALAMERGRSGENYILGGENVSFDEFFERLGAMAPKRRIMFHLPARLALVFARWELLLARLTSHWPLITPDWTRTFLADWNYSSGKAQRELGYHITPLQLALQQTLSWLGGEPPEPQAEPGGERRAS